MLDRIVYYFNTQKARINRLSREGSWIVAGQAVNILGTLVLVRVLTEHLEPYEYGHLALGLTVAGFVNQVIMGGVNSGIGRFFSIAAEKNDTLGYLRASSRLLLTATGIVLGIAAAFFGALVTLGLHEWLGLAVTAVVFSILSGYNSVLNGIQNAARQRKIVALHGGMDSWLKIGMALAVMFWLGNHSTSVVLGYALSALLVTLSQLYFLNRLVRNQGRNQYIGSTENWSAQIWAFSWPFSAWGVFTWLQQVSDRWALGSFATTTEVGKYAVVFQLGYMPIGILTGFMMSLIGPILYQRSGAAQDAKRNVSVHRIAWRITQATLFATASGFLLTWFFHDYLFRWLVSVAFRDASFLLPWVVLAGGLFATGQMLSVKLISELRSDSLLAVKILTAVLGVAANTIGAWFYGIEGVVGALVFFSVTYAVWMFILASNLPEIQPTNNLKK